MRRPLAFPSAARSKVRFRGRWQREALTEEVVLRRPAPLAEQAPQERDFFGGLPQNPETSLQRTLRAVRSFQGFWVAGRRFHWGSATNEGWFRKGIRQSSFVGAAMRWKVYPCARLSSSLPQRPRRGLRALHIGCAGPKPATGKALPGRGAIWGRWRVAPDEVLFASSETRIVVGAPLRWKPTPAPTHTCQSTGLPRRPDGLLAMTYHEAHPNHVIARPERPWQSGSPKPLRSQCPFTFGGSPVLNSSFHEKMPCNRGIVDYNISKP